MEMTDVFDEYGNYKYPDYSNSQYTHDVSTTGGKMMGMIEDKDIDLHIDRETLLQEYIPKAQYEQRLKADMVAMLEELKEQLREMHEDYFETEHFDEAYGVSDSMDLIEEKTNNLKEQKMGMTIDKAKWQPFDSTIPLEDGDYLVTYEDPQTHKLQVLIARYHMAEHEEDECRFYDDTEVEITLAVTAWQPLPEPYKEDD